MIKKTLLTIAGAAAVIGLGAAPASASGEVSTPGSRLVFYSNVDTFRLHDTLCEGRGVEFQFRTSYGFSGTKTWAGEHCGRSKPFPVDFIEDSTIQYRVHVIDGPWSPWRNDTPDS